jgi:threonine/homoserine/homoserine lactone efflux protein
VTVYPRAESHGLDILIVTAVFALVNVPCISAWCGLGTLLRRFLERPSNRRMFNWTMAVLLVASLLPMLG